MGKVADENKIKCYELIGMSKVKADDMDAIDQSGAANLLRMNVKEIERLTAHNEKLQEQVDSLQQKVHLCTRYDQLEAVYEPALQVYREFDGLGHDSVYALEKVLIAVQTTEQVENDG